MPKVLTNANQALLTCLLEISKKKKKAEEVESNFCYPLYHQCLEKEGCELKKMCAVDI